MKDSTRFEFTFDQTVTVTRSFYPEISWTNFFSQLGGSLGLWLGLGVLQMSLNMFEFLMKLKKIVITRKE